jgi:hypothetical protein
MPKFGEVFSTTWKVLLALFLISVGLSVLYFIIAAIGSSSSSSSSTDSIHNQMADEKHTSMPLSKWNAHVAAAIKQHCPLQGMTKQEVENAIGKPVNTYGASVWEYERTAQKENCNKYVGENCSVETVHETEIFYFSPNGYLIAPSFLGDENGWLYGNCFEEPFYSKYFKDF